MHSELNAQLAFHLTGVRNAEGIAPVEGRALRPALLAQYRDLAALRYDFPLVLVENAADGQYVRTLAALVDEALAGVADERLRAQARRRESEIRAQLAKTPSNRLSSLWTAAPKLAADGAVVDCDAALPARFTIRAWNAVQAAKARRFHGEVDRLVLELSNILAADFVQSDEGRSAERLAASFAARDDTFDTQALSRLLAKALPERRLPDTRRRRIRSLLSTLKGQRFFPGGEAGADAEPYAFVFHGCAAALEALRERRAATIQLAKAIAAARLESRGEYVDAAHDPLFHELADNAVDPALLPDYLVCLNARDLSAAAEASGLPELLASGMPVKILVQHDDLLERSPVANGPAFGTKARLLAGMALGLNDVFVLQSSASNLYPLREQVLRGLAYPGVALFSVFSGAGMQCDGLPPYLVAAAAAESRAFPSFVYDPSAPGDAAARFSLEANPQPDADWPRHAVSYEDAEHQRVREELPFTLTDFAACDARYAGSFAAVPREKVNGAVPSLRMVDAENRLHAVIVAEPLVREAKRCLDAWHALQARVKRAAPPAAPAPSPQPEKPAAKPAAPAPAAKAAEPEAKAPASDDPYIETPRCTTCEECMKVNNRLFAYDANKQAYIADLSAGSYRDLVEAAEVCQVSIIHPGKPRNPDEPGLDELLQRAAAFA